MTDNLMDFENAKSIHDPVKSELPKLVLSDVPVFDHEALLPPELIWWIYDEATRSGAPIEYVAVAALVSAGNLIGPKISIQPKRHDHQWIMHPNLWGMAVGKPTVKKTPGLKAGIRHTTSIEKDLRVRHKEEMKLFKSGAKVRASRLRSAIKHFEKLQTKALEDESAVPATKIQHAENAIAEAAKVNTEPQLKRLTINDATVEALGEILNTNSGVLQFRDELAGWLNGLNREDRHNDRAFFLEAFNGTGDYTYDRIGRGHLYIEHNILGVLGGIQPDKIKPIIRNALSGGGDNDGLIQRFSLMVYPNPPTAKDEDRQPHKESFDKAAEAFAHLARLPFSAFQLQFNDAAYTGFTEWRHSLQSRLETSDYHSALQGHINKYDKACASLAAIFATLGKREVIDCSDLNRAIAWCDFLESHAVRIYGMGDTA